MFEHFFPSWWRCWKVMEPLGGGDLLGDNRALLVAFDGLQPGPTFCLGSTSRMQMQCGQPASCSFLHSFPSTMDSHPYKTMSQKKSSLIPPPPSKENRTQPKVKAGAEPALSHSSISPSSGVLAHPLPRLLPQCVVT